ncbi:hypothetical protein K2X33_10335, partial [bacterium]|nr:hypothetical protein [bacterium]
LTLILMAQPASAAAPMLKCWGPNTSTGTLGWVEVRVIKDAGGIRLEEQLFGNISKDRRDRWDFIEPSATKTLVSGLQCHQVAKRPQLLECVTPNVGYGTGDFAETEIRTVHALSYENDFGIKPGAYENTTTYVDLFVGKGSPNDPESLKNSAQYSFLWERCSTTGKYAQQK